MFINPRLALRYLAAEAKSGHQWAPTVLLTLRAEAHLRVHQDAAAYDAAAAAAGMPDAAESELLAAVTVLADISCWTGDPSASDVCSAYQQIADRHADADRAVWATALKAIADYQRHSCEQGREELDRAARLCNRRSADSVLATITDARTVMELGCRPSGYVLDRLTWAPAPGGQLCAVNGPWPRVLSSRVRRRPPTHTCGSTPAPAPQALDKEEHR